MRDQVKIRQENFSEEGSFDAFYTVTAPMIRKQLRRLGITNPQDLEDILSTSFFKLSLALKQGNVLCPVAFLTTVAKTSAMDQHRYHKSHKQQAHCSLDSARSEHNQAQVCERKYLHDDLIVKMKRILADFESQAQSRLLSLRFLEERGIHEICRELQIPAGSYGYREQKLLSAFRRYLTNTLVDGGLIWER